MPPLMAPPSRSSASAALPHLSLHLNPDYPLLLFPASPGLPPQSPISPSYQTRSSSPPRHGPSHLAQPTRSMARAPSKSTRRRSAAAATPRTPDPAVPVHPIPSMQAAFAESLYEATQNAMPEGAVHVKPQLRDSGPDAKTRYDALLSDDADAPPPSSMWRYRPGQTQHELWKLEAQVAFGMHLLLHGMANDNAQVVTILQGHIDELDEFLETALEDLAQAVADLAERIGFLRLPMENMAVFENLLEKRDFRAQIADGNEKIEHVLSRARRMLAQFDDDIAHGLRATREFSAHLARERDGDWMNERIDVLPIYEAMRGNADGWMNAFGDLGAKAAELDDLITRLSGIVVFIAAKAGEVSRKTWSAIPPFSVPPQPRPDSPSDSVRSAGSEGSQATRITGFPMPPQAKPRMRGHSMTSSAVLPGGECKFFYDDDDDDGEKEEVWECLQPLRYGDNRASPSSSGSGHGVLGGVVGGGSSVTTTGKVNDNEANDEGNDDNNEDDYEDAEIMDAVEYKLPRLTLNITTGLDLRLSLDFGFSDDRVVRDSRDSATTGSSTSTATDDSTFDGGVEESVDSGDETERVDEGDETEKEEAKSPVSKSARSSTSSTNSNSTTNSKGVGNNRDSTPPKTFGDIRIEIEADDGRSDIRTSIVDAPEDLFILQPRTYTPTLPAPVPSPMVRSPVLGPVEEPLFPVDDDDDDPDDEKDDVVPEFTVQTPPSPTLAMGFPAPPTATTRRPSLRQRVSLKIKPPESIHIPRRPLENQSPASSMGRFKPSHTTTNSTSTIATTTTTTTYLGGPPTFHDSGYVRDSTYDDAEAEADSRRRSLSQSNPRPPMQSPYSDQVFYNTGLESPQVPFHVQQRPHSADNQRQPQRPPPQHQYSHQYQHAHQQQMLLLQQQQQQYPHLRAAPSRNGGMSLLSNVTTMTYDPHRPHSSVSNSGSDASTPGGFRSVSAAGTAAGGERKMKKKKSAFGWFRKAFTMDEEERAAFEARRMGGEEYFGQFAEARSPRFLDGRRVG